MKLLHTADWHLGQKLYNFDRKDEQLFFLQQIATAVRDHKPDALLICGDIFDTPTPNIETQKLFVDELVQIHQQHTEMEIFVIAGNHDSYSRLEIDKTLWDTLRIHIIGNTSSDLDTHIFHLAGKGFIAAVPFCSERNYPVVNDDESDDRQQEFFNAIAAAIDERNADGEPCVLMAHLAVAGSITLGHTTKTNAESIESVGGLQYIDTNMFPPTFDYVALGHIHHPQFVGKSKRIRYSGTPFAASFDEHYPHSISLIEIDRHQNEPIYTEITMELLRNVYTIPSERPSEGCSLDEAIAELENHLANDEYIRINLAMNAGESPAQCTDEVEKILNANDAQCRFCCIHPIRSVTKTETAERKSMTITELQELSSDEILSIVTQSKKLSEEEQAMLQDVIQSLQSTNNR